MPEFQQVGKCDFFSSCVWKECGVFGSVFCEFFPKSH